MTVKLAVASPIALEAVRVYTPASSRETEERERAEPVRLGVIVAPFRVHANEGSGQPPTVMAMSMLSPAVGVNSVTGMVMDGGSGE